MLLSSAFGEKALSSPMWKKEVLITEAIALGTEEGMGRDLGKALQRKECLSVRGWLPTELAKAISWDSACDPERKPRLIDQVQSIAVPFREAAKICGHLSRGFLEWPMSVVAEWIILPQRASSALCLDTKTHSSDGSERKGFQVIPFSLAKTKRNVPLELL